MLLVGAIVGWRMGDSWAKSKGFSGLWDMITTSAENLVESSPPDYHLFLEIDDKDFQQLFEERNDLLEYGLKLNAGGYVDATLEMDGVKYNVEIRLKGHMTDHLQDEKWSFRVKVKNGDRILGMERFTLQHPGTRNYIYEYIYHQLMAEEGIISLFYDFSALEVNGESWGLYAIEEHFGPDVLERNNRPAGAIIRFNPNLYWEMRGNEHEGYRMIDEFASMESAYLEAYEEKDMLADEVLRENFLTGMGMLEGFRRKELTTSQVFDVDKLARFHAIIDLIGGHHSLDWSDVKYTYNSLTGKIEPVAYESFSAWKIWQLGGQFRFGRESADFHDWMFSDSLFFEAYVQHLNRIADSDYMDEFMVEHQEEINHRVAVLHGEFSYKTFDFSIYDHNQEAITRLLTPDQGVHAYLQKSSADSIWIMVASVDGFPYELEEVSSTLHSVPIQFITGVKQPDAPLTYQTVALPWPEDFNSDESAKEELNITYHMLGSEVELTREVHQYPFPADYTVWSTPPTNISQYSFLSVRENSKEIVFAPGEVHIEEDLRLPAGYTTQLGAGTHLLLDSGITLTIESSLAAWGSEEWVVGISGAADAKIAISGSPEISLDHVHISNVQVQVYNSVFSLTNSLSEGSQFNFVASEVEIKNVEFNHSPGIALTFLHTTAKIEKTGILNSSMGVLASFSKLDVSRLSMVDCASGLDADYTSNIKINKLEIRGASEAIKVNNGSKIKGSGLTIKEAKLAIDISGDDKELGSSKMEVSGYTYETVEVDYNMKGDAKLILNEKELVDSQTMIEKN